MFGIGSTELMVILVVALLVLGPKNLPKIAQTLGKALGEFRRVSTDFQRTLNTEVAFEEEAEKHKAKAQSAAKEEPGPSTDKDKTSEPAANARADSERSNNATAPSHAPATPPEESAGAAQGGEKA